MSTDFIVGWVIFCLLIVLIILFIIPGRGPKYKVEFTVNEYGVGFYGVSKRYGVFYASTHVYCRDRESAEKLCDSLNALNDKYKNNNGQ